LGAVHLTPPRSPPSGNRSRKTQRSALVRRRSDPPLRSLYRRRAVRASRNLAVCARNIQIRSADVLVRRRSLLVGEGGVGRVHTRRQPEALGDALQQIEQLLALLGAQAGAEIALMVDGEGEGAAEQLAGGVCQVQLAGAAG